MAEFTVGSGGSTHYITASRVNELPHGLEFLDKGYNRVAFFKEYDYFVNTSAGDPSNAAN